MPADGFAAISGSRASGRGTSPTAAAAASATSSPDLTERSDQLKHRRAKGCHLGVPRRGRRGFAAGSGNPRARRFVPGWDADRAGASDRLAAATVQDRGRAPGAERQRPCIHHRWRPASPRSPGCARRLYWTVDPLQLHPAVVEHVRLGEALLAETERPARTTTASALAESGLLIGWRNGCPEPWHLIPAGAGPGRRG
jgi:hypothetical protein